MIRQKNRKENTLNLTLASLLLCCGCIAVCTMVLAIAIFRPSLLLQPYVLGPVAFFAGLLLCRILESNIHKKAARKHHLEMRELQNQLHLASSNKDNIKNIASKAYNIGHATDNYVLVEFADDLKNALLVGSMPHRDASNSRNTNFPSKR